MNCTSCGTENDAGNRFCQQCGAVMAAKPTCRSCGTTLAADARFCTDCGTAVAPKPEIPQGPGHVVDGEWHRAPGELVRLVPGEALRSAFARFFPGLDWPAFLRGTLAARMIDALMAKSIRVPMGSVGVVARDGRVVRILPPGDQTTPGLLRDLVRGEVDSAPAEALSSLLSPDRISLYLVDRRPIPVSFASEQPTDTGTRTIGATTLVSVGTSPEALTAFITDVVADKDTLSAEDLYVRFRGEIERAVADALRARPKDLPGAEKAARDALRARFGARTGLSFDLVLAPRHTVHRLDLSLGGAVASASSCPACGASVRPGQRFCIGCGESQPSVEVPDALYTSDGAAIELDLALSVQGERAPDAPEEVLRSAAARYLRTQPWTEVKTPEGMDALESALIEASRDALSALGYRLLDLDLIDVRSAGAQWLLGARAQIGAAKAELMVGREWLAVRDDQLAIEELSATVAAKSERIRRNAAYEAHAAAVEDAKRHAALEAEERALQRSKDEAEHDDTMAADARAHARTAQTTQNRAELDRQRMALDSEQRRLRVDDEAYAEKARREARLTELQGMADLDARMSEQEQRHRIERMEAMSGQSEAQMLAMQAADLATKEHGAAFAAALGKIADAESAKRERERSDEAAKAAAEAMRELTKTAIEANARVAAAKASAAGPALATSCPTCGNTLAPAAKFCGGCGTALV